jgi:hypothetical protein
MAEIVLLSRSVWPARGQQFRPPPAASWDCGDCITNVGSSAPLRCGSAVLVEALPPCHSHRVKRSLHRCFVALGLLAMAMALAAIPAGIVLASAKTDMAAMSAGSDDMPCDHPCPGCAKPCPDMGTCLLKCFQPLSSSPAQSSVRTHSLRQRIPPGLSRRITEAALPPLLRPPSV